MTTERELTGAVRAWLEEGATRLPDRVLDAVLEEVPAIPQRGPVWQIWRPAARRRTLGVAAAVAAVVLTITAVSRFLPSPAPGFGNNGPSSGPGVSAEPSPSPSPSPTEFLPAPSAAALEVPSAGTMVGRYVWTNLNATGIDVEFTAPPRWTSCCGGYTQQADGTTQFMVWQVGVIYPDPCTRPTIPDEVAMTVQDHVNAFRAQRGRMPVRAAPSASAQPLAPEPTTVGGFSGTRLQVQVPFDTVIPNCTAGTYVGWTMRGNLDDTRFNQSPGQIDDLRIVDVDGVILTIQTSYDPDTDQARRDELDALVDSIIITPPPALPQPSASFVRTDRPEQSLGPSPAP